MIIDFVITCFLAGLGTYGLSETVTGESGPFHIFDRLRFWLIPEVIRPMTIDFEYGGYENNLNDLFEDYRPFISELDNELDSLKEILEYDENFTNSLKGTLFNILDCRFCFGVWAAHLITPLLFISFFGFTLSNFGLGLLLSFISVGFQRLIISYSNKR